MFPFADELSNLSTENTHLFDQPEDIDPFPQTNFLAEAADFNMIQTHVQPAQPMMESMNEPMAVSPMSTSSGASSFFTSEETFFDLEPYLYTDQASPASTVLSEQEWTEAYELVMEDMLPAIGTRLGIPQDPTQWTQDQVQSWITLLIKEYGHPSVNITKFQVPGFTLCTMSQEDLELLAPGNGYFLHSNLTCLKNIPKDDVKPIITQYQQQYQQQQYHQQYQPTQQEQQAMSYVTPMMYPGQYTMSSPVQIPKREQYTMSSPVQTPEREQYTMSSTIATSSVHTPEREYAMSSMRATAPPAHNPEREQYTMSSMGATSPVNTTEREQSASPQSSSSEEDEMYRSSPVPSPPTGPNTSMTPHHTGAIQLWQFLQELLNQPDSYNYCIRFLDREHGIFKIEDSVEVARLWGMRKNRPAMNYDKLSRSIRQYYRKRIMKKTEISQRLVYQFITPF